MARSDFDHATGGFGKPLKEVLDPGTDEARIHAVWQGIDARHDGARRPVGLRTAIAGLSFAAIAAVVIASLARTPTAPHDIPFLALASGAAPTELRASDGPRVMELADGSRIDLEVGGTITPTRNDATDFALRLVGGAARFSVTPGGHRRWSIDCGHAVVEVVGTEFRIVHEERGLWVSVQRGRVRVTADGIDAMLGRGEEIRVPFPAAVPERTETATLADAIEPDALAPDPREPAAMETLEGRPERTRLPTAPEARWITLAREGEYGTAYEALHSDEDSGRAVTSASELMLLADVARLSGHPADATEPLERLLRDHGEDRLAGLAAIMLGRIYQDTLHRPRDAMRALERAVALGPPSSLASDVESRLALAEMDAGDPRGLEAARRYLAAHPEGPRADVLRARLDAANPGGL